MKLDQATQETIRRVTEIVYSASPQDRDNIAAVLLCITADLVPEERAEALLHLTYLTKEQRK